MRDVLEQRRLSRLRRRDDQTALPLAERHEQIEHARGQALRLRLQLEHVIRIDGDQFGEGTARLAELLEREPFHLFQSDELEVVAGAARAARQVQPGLQVELFDDGARDDGVARGGDVIVLRLHEHAGAVRLDPQNAAGRNELAARDFDRRATHPLLLHHSAAAAASMTGSPATSPAATRSGTAG